MSEQVRRALPVPLLIPTLGWMLGISLAAVFSISLPWLLLISGVVLGLGLILRMRLPLVFLIFVLAGFLRLTVQPERPPTPLQQILEKRESIVQSCTGKVVRVIDRQDNLYLVQLTSVNTASVNDLALLSHSTVMLPGDRFKALAEITARRLDPVLDDDSFYYSRHYRKTSANLSTVYRLEKTADGDWYYPERVRYRLLEKLDAKLGPDAPFAKALLLNDRTEDREWVEQLILGGLLHLIAISGLHVMLFYLVLVDLFAIVLPRRASELVFVVLMLFYAALCQWSPPVMRAIVMILLYVGARLLQRPVSPLQIMALSLLLITLVDPVQLFSIGLQLSYLCVLTIFLISPLLRHEVRTRSPWKKGLIKSGYWLLDMVFISVGISVFLLPLTLYYFLRASLNAIPGNVLGIPLIGFLLPLSLVLMFLPQGWLFFQWLRPVYAVALYVFDRWVEWTAKLPFYLDSVALSLPMLVALYLVLGAVLVRLKTGLRLRRLSYALLLLSVPFFIWSSLPLRQPFKLTVFNAGMGDCTLVQYPDGQVLMVDTGPVYTDKEGNLTGSWLGSRLKRWLVSKKLSTVDLLVLTHLHDDHAGGVTDLFSSMRVRNLIVSGHTARTREWQALLQSGILKDTRITVLEDTLSLPFAGSRLTFLHPAADYPDTDANDCSLVLRLDYKDFSALLAADITATAEQHLLMTCPALLDADLLKAPHHGSRSSNSAAFIQAVSPRQVCITASRRNRFRFPHTVTLQRYAQYGVKPVVTGDGSFVITLP
jgi:competence protein ComEC